MIPRETPRKKQTAMGGKKKGSRVTAPKKGSYLRSGGLRAQLQGDTGSRNMRPQCPDLTQEEERPASVPSTDFQTTQKETSEKERAKRQRHS